jgi:hypothetical protein
MNTLDKAEFSLYPQYNQHDTMPILAILSGYSLNNDAAKTQMIFANLG